MKLTDEQAEIVHSRARAIVINAGAGCGKTSTVIARIQAVQQAENQCRPVLYLAFNRAMRQEMQQKLTKLKIRNIDVHTFHSFALTIVKAAGRTLLNDDQFSRILYQSIRDNWHLFQSQHEITPATIGAIASDYRIQLETGAISTRLLPIHTAITNTLGSNNQTSLATVVLEAALCPSDLWPQYQYIYVDESQDISRNRLDLTLAILEHSQLSDDKPSICFVGDDRQAIYGFAGADPQLLNRVKILLPELQRYQLTQSFRFTPTIAKAAHAIVSSRLPNQTPVRTYATRDHSPNPINLSGSWRPTVHRITATLRHLQRVGWSDNSPGSIALLCRYQSTVAMLRQHPAVKNWPTDITVASIHQAKGLEWDWVVIFDVFKPTSSELGFPCRYAQSTADLDTEYRLMYVAITRAKRGIVIPYQYGKQSDFMRQLKK